jgi:thiol-disulfide isomerase/thioredoxin
MKYLFAILAVVVSIYVIYRGYPIVQYYYKKYTASSKGLNTKAPNAKAFTMDGKEWSVKANLGKDIIIVYWSSYCPPCIAEFPKIQKIYDKYKDDKSVEIVTYSLDLSLDPEMLKPYIKNKGINYPVLIDHNPIDSEENFAKKFEVFGAPSFWFIDKKGTILASNRRSIEEMLPFIEK